MERNCDNCKYRDVYYMAPPCDECNFEYQRQPQKGFQNWESERPIKELTEDEVKEYRVIKAALDAGATVKKAPEGEGGVYLRGRKLSTEEVMDCIFKQRITNADRIRSLSDEELAEFLEAIISQRQQTILENLNGIGIDDVNLVEFPSEAKQFWLDWLKKEAEGRA